MADTKSAQAVEITFKLAILAPDGEVVSRDAAEALARVLGVALVTAGAYSPGVSVEGKRLPPEAVAALREAREGDAAWQDMRRGVPKREAPKPEARGFGTYL